MTVEDLAKALKIDISQAYKIVRSGKIAAFKEGRDWKIAKPALINYVLDENKPNQNKVEIVQPFQISKTKRRTR